MLSLLDSLLPLPLSIPCCGKNCCSCSQTYSFRRGRGCTAGRRRAAGIWAGSVLPELIVMVAHCNHGAVVVHDHHMNFIAAAGDSEADTVTVVWPAASFTPDRWQTVRVFTLGIFASRSLKRHRRRRKPPRCEREAAANICHVRFCPEPVSVRVLLGAYAVAPARQTPWPSAGRP